MEYYSAWKKKEILPFVTTWMNMEGIMLSKISQAEKDKYCMVWFMCEIQNKQTNIETENKMVAARGWGVREDGERLVGKSINFQL